MKGIPKVLREWKKGKEEDLQAFINRQDQTAENSTKNLAAFDVLTYVKPRILNDQHLPEASFPHIHRYLNGEPNIIDKIKTALAAGPKETINNLGFEYAFIQALESKRLDLFQKAQKFSSKFGIETFSSDLNYIINELDGNKQNRNDSTFSGCKITDTDDPNDFILAGTEVDASCQHLLNGITTNTGILGLLLNGKNRLLAIKNKNGEIIARMIFRVMYDSKKMVPVLHIDRLYTHSSISRSHAQQWLLIFVKERATKLGLTLTGAEEFGKKRYDGALQSLGGISPYEYVDSGGGLSRNGEYTIQAPRIIQ